jgi:amino acid adenylation domain-containing protein
MSSTPGSAEDRLNSLSTERSQLLKLLIERDTREQRKIRAVPRSALPAATRLPTSWAQQRLWFIRQLEGKSEVYHIAAAFSLRGALNEAALHKAMDALVRRHEALRTVFVNERGSPEQEIQPYGRFAMPVIDLCSLAPEMQAARVEDEKLREIRTGFDLSVGPLIRGRLLRLQVHHHLLMITMHHIISDGWSMSVLVRELGQLYEALLHGSEASLDSLPIQYADYAIWQRESFQGDARENQLGYWRERLRGAPAQLELPTDRPRPAAQSFQGANLEMRLNAELTGRLRSFAYRHDVTLFMVLYAGWAILLSRLSGQTDIVIGTPTANRQQPELSSLIGFFVNTLALRLTVRPDASVRELLNHVKDVTLGAYQHQDVAFEQVVEAVHPERSLSRNPLFQVMFILQSTPAAQLHLADLQVTREAELYESAMFDLMFSLEEQASELTGTLNYAKDLFDRATIERWITSYQLLLRAIVDMPDASVTELPILTQAQRKLLLEDFNATQADYRLERSIPSLFEEQARRSPGVIAVEYEEQAVSYAHLNSRADRLALALRSRGVRADEPVGICLPRGLDMVVAVLATLKAGGAYLPLDPNYPRKRIQHMLEDAKPRLVLTQNELRAVLPDCGAQLVALDASSVEPADTCAEDSSFTAEVPVTNAALAYVMYTSGSTGRPKGTAMPHRPLVNLIEWHRERFGSAEGKRVLQFAALSFDVAFQEMFTTLCTGGTLVLVDEWLRRDARALTEFLAHRAVNRLFLPPLMLQSIAEHCRTDRVVLDQLRDVICAGEQLRITPEIVGFFKKHRQCRLHNHYGPTETHVVTSLTLSDEPDRWPALPTIGRPIANTQIYILDHRGNPVPIGVAGELYIGGVSLANGYLNREELTAARFVPDPFTVDAQRRLYRTGDVCMWQADGQLKYLGRNDDQVKVRGFRIELGEIEAQLARHASIRDVAVVAREDGAGQKHLVAYFTVHSDHKPKAEELRAFLKAFVPSHMVPSAFVVLDSLPVTSSGKLDRRSLPAPDLDAYASEPYEEPRGEIEQALAQIWGDLLGVSRIGRRDNFFELGGHSLLGTKLVAHIAEHHCVRLPVVAVFRSPTIREMAQIIEMQRSRREGTGNDAMEIEDGVI